ncbi:phosphoserine phosphatase SerB [Crenobacter cavernae]|uniref:Phosphoserine phosphatase n=1 Tax=Crenobacter cavernae TaxID=2290923 RepID=A0A345Y6N1_9NEIS|nr:phosphoserine phosphatase SerB [Crenobacter cavernae]AXK39583.1 phosphoserine phosphatase SerB [Crenobacter cavernae]
MSAYTLVLQAPALSDTDVAALAELSGAAEVVRRSANVARLANADPARRDAVAAYCDAAGIDAAFVPAGKRFSDYGLIVSDMDSTLITIECIDEIADMQGLKDQVAAITERSMRGELDFVASLIERVALLKGLPEEALSRVYAERIELTPGAAELLAACKQHGVRFQLVSGGFTFFTEKLKAELGLDYAFANTLEVEDGRLTGRVLGDIVDAAAKARLLRETRDALGLKPEQVIAIGDGANDLLMLAEAGLGVAYKAKPVVRKQADVAINHGGLDAVLGLFA